MIMMTWRVMIMMTWMVIIMMARMVMVMIITTTTMMMVCTNKYICKKLLQAWLAALSPNVILIKMMMTLMLMVDMMTQTTNKQTKIFARKNCWRENYKKKRAST